MNACSPIIPTVLISYEFIVIDAKRGDYVTVELQLLTGPLSSTHIIHE
jgi:hypothetical protein